MLKVSPKRGNLWENPCAHSRNVRSLPLLRTALTDYELIGIYDVHNSTGTMVDHPCSVCPGPYLPGARGVFSTGAKCPMMIHLNVGSYTSGHPTDALFFLAGRNLEEQFVIGDSTVNLLVIGCDRKAL